MNNPPRGTYLNKSKPNSHLTSAHIQRTTVNNTSVTKQQGQKGPSQQEKMIIKILDVVSRLENPNNTPALSKETLKIGSQKAFFDVLCIFFRAIDGHTQRTDFTSLNNTELMLDALRVFGYKGNYNKSLFQPVGAPHTWTQCLTILEWFSQLALYTYSFQSVLQERVFEEDQQSLTLNNFLTRKEEPITNYIHNQIQHLQAQISNNSFTVESKQMAIRNQHAAQKELPLIEKELQKERELSYRARQESMGVEAEVKAVELKIQAKQQDLTQALQKQAQGMASLEKIRYQIIHQELHPDQCEKIKLEIRDTKNKISEIQQGISQTIDIQRTVNKQYLEIITDKASIVRKFGEKLTASPLVSESDLKLQIPTLSQMELNDLLRNSFQEWSLDLEAEGRLEVIFKEREYGQFFRKMEEFISKQEARLGREEEILVNKQQEVQSLDSKSKDFQENIERLDKSKKAKQSKSSVVQSQKHDLERSIHELEGELHTAHQEISQKNLQKEHIMLEVKQVLTDLKAMEEATKEAERIRAQFLRSTKEKLQTKKRECLDRIDNYKRSLFVIFNSDFQSKFQSH